MELIKLAQGFWNSMHMEEEEQLQVGQAWLMIEGRVYHM